MFGSIFLQYSRPYQTKSNIAKQAGVGDLSYENVADDGQKRDISKRMAGPEYAVVHDISLTSTDEESGYAYAYADVTSTEQAQLKSKAGEYQYEFVDVKSVDISQKVAGNGCAYYMNLD